MYRKVQDTIYPSRSIRDWFRAAGPSQDKTSAQGSCADLADGIVQAKLALAVAHAIKVVYLKEPKTKDKKARKTMVNKAKTQISAAKLGKDREVASLESPSSFLVVVV